MDLALGQASRHLEGAADTPCSVQMGGDEAPGTKDWQGEHVYLGSLLGGLPSEMTCSGLRSIVAIQHQPKAALGGKGLFQHTGAIFIVS